MVVGNQKKGWSPLLSLQKRKFSIDYQCERPREASAFSKATAYGANPIIGLQHS